MTWNPGAYELDWTYLLPNPFHWEVWQCLTHDGVYARDDVLDGVARAYTPPVPRFYKIWGVDAGGVQLTGWSNIVEVPA